MISINHLEKRFGRTQALDKLSLSIAVPGIYCILGPNGSGKTTMIKSLLGMVIPDKGRIEINSRPVIGEWKYREGIDYLPQSASFPPNLSPKELISLMRYLRGRKGREEELIALFGLEPHLGKKVRTLSGGTRQKLNLLLALMFDNPLMILDEPTNGLDPVSVLLLKRFLASEKAAGKTILITTHIMQLVEEVADEVIFLLDGKIRYKGGLQELIQLNSSRTLEEAIAQLLSENV